MSPFREPDSVYLFSYATAKNNNHNGLHFAWSRDKREWHSIGNETSYLRCDYGRWGSEKRMLSPYLFRDKKNTWHCIWSVNERENILAHAASDDLVEWKRQSYHYLPKGVTCIQPVIAYDSQHGNYVISYGTDSGKYYSLTTDDFKSFGASEEIPLAKYLNTRESIVIQQSESTGQVHYVAWSVVQQLIKTNELQQFAQTLNSERTEQDAQRFAGLKPVTSTVTVDAANTKPISDLLMGIFFEDINYAADGGLYAELVQNRDFEYALSDKAGRDKVWTASHSWTTKGDVKFTIDSTSPLHGNNPHYAVLEYESPGGSLINTGFGGIPVKKGEQYNLALFAKQLAGKGNKLTVRLVGKGGPLAQATISTASTTWKYSKAILIASADDPDATLEIELMSPGRIALDMISLFPQSTFKGRKNGLRADLAQTIADIHPRFVRFPGGCVAHGDGIGNIYRWKNSIGPLEGRKPQRNLWGYHQSAGLGYYEYFQFCEDIGAEPVPVIAAGVPCQNSGTGGGGQQGGIPMQEMDEYVQEIVDLIEYANGDARTTWGKKRAESGHSKPFNLKYIGIGNEDLITDVFEERFIYIYNAIKAKHPEITVIGTVGPFNEGTDYVEGWDLANRLNVPMVDEHYYQSPGWFINNQDYYDRYDRSASKVYLGEYAAHLPGRPSNLETALAEALYLTALERNGDIVSMASYAPLLAKEGYTQWKPDLIYFNNTTVKPTVDYYVQKLFGTYAGDEYLTSKISLSNTTDAVSKRISISVVRNSKSGEVILKMVNLLPVAVTHKVELPGIDVGATAKKIIMQGNPADTNTLPVESVFQVSGLSSIELPPYSFTVIVLK